MTEPTMLARFDQAWTLAPAVAGLFAVAGLVVVATTPFPLGLTLGVLVAALSFVPAPILMWCEKRAARRKP